MEMVKRARERERERERERDREYATLGKHRHETNLRKDGIGRCGQSKSLLRHSREAGETLEQAMATTENQMMKTKKTKKKKKKKKKPFVERRDFINYILMLNQIKDYNFIVSN
jgi:predicted ribosome quality control (RQC) complex YloA/Tae2 family protein